jgi:hypothetical protein
MTQPIATVNTAVSIVKNKDIERISILEVYFSIWLWGASIGNRRIKADMSSGMKKPAIRIFGSTFRMAHSSPAG